MLGRPSQPALEGIQPLLISSYTFTSFLSSSTVLLSFPFPLSLGGRVLRHYFLPTPAIVLSADTHFLGAEMLLSSFFFLQQIFEPGWIINLRVEALWD